MSNQTVARTGRPPREDRDSVANITLTIRLSPRELAGLEVLVDRRAAEIQRLVPGASVTRASLIRAIIRDVVIEQGAMPENATPPAPSAPDPRQRAVRPVSVEDVAALIMPGALVSVPSIVRKLGPGAIAVLDAGARAGRWELRPDSGVSAAARLSAADAALCPRALDGTPLSMVMLTEAHVSSPDPTPSDQIQASSVDRDKLRRRLDKAIKAGRTVAAIADAAGIHRGTLSGFRGGRPLGEEKAAELAAYLDSIGV